MRGNDPGPIRLTKQTHQDLPFFEGEKFGSDPAASPNGQTLGLFRPPTSAQRVNLRAEGQPPRLRAEGQTHFLRAKNLGQTLSLPFTR